MGWLQATIVILWRLGVAALLALVCLGGALLAVVHIADGAVISAVRNTVFARLAQALPPALAPLDPATQPAGGLTGLVRDRAGAPIAGAAVIAADARGVAYRATTDAAGRYRLDGVPAGVYRAVAAMPGHGPVADWLNLPTPWVQLGALRWRAPTVVRAGRAATADLQLGPPEQLAPTVGARLTFGEETVVEQGDPFPGMARRQPFTLTTPSRDPIVLDALRATVAPAPPVRAATGVIYAPAEGGPFPTILIIYPGLPETWEAVSVALATDGFTVVAFTPLNFPDFTADTSDLLFLTQELSAGRLTPHAAPGRQCTAGGSFSTLWTFLLVEQTDAYRCVLSLGGLSDAYLYREDWSAGRITPDPHLAPVPEMMAAVGTPDVGPDLYLRLSVIEHTDRLPPILIVHGSGDTIVPINQSLRLAERLQAQGKPYELKLYNGMEHYLDAARGDADTLDLLRRTLAFFHRHLD
jgi:hypothetical protein